jgi:nucleoside 2-deoxyribosyltransferase
MKAAVYIAARFSRRHEAHALGKELQSKGYRISCRWIRPGDSHVMPVGLSEQAEDSERARFAAEDMEDIYGCDWMISLTEQPRSNGRGGRHVEFGVGLALGKVLTVIGPRETVFHHLPGIEHFNSIGEFLESVR